MRRSCCLLATMLSVVVLVFAAEGAAGERARYKHEYACKPVKHQTSPGRTQHAIFTFEVVEGQVIGKRFDLHYPAHSFTAKERELHKLAVDAIKQKKSPVVQLRLAFTLTELGQKQKRPEEPIQVSWKDVDLEGWKQVGQ